MSNSRDNITRSGHGGQAFVIAAPSGAGKTSLVKALLKLDPRLVLSVSHTTRPPRPGERDGQHYHFVSADTFQNMVDGGEFLEYARVFDHYYGTSRNALAQQLASDHDVILEIDWQGAQQVRNAFPDCCSIFVLPPTLSALHDRLANRGQDSEAVILRRMRDAKAEISHWAEFDFLVVNDEFELALEELAAIIGDHRLQVPHPPNKAYQRLAQRLGRS